MSPKSINRCIEIAVLAVLAIGIVLLVSCADPREDERRKQTANSAATIYEAAVAIEQGASVAQPAAAIRANASAIATAQGHPYPLKQDAKP